ncbi:MAG: hypothetical protein ACP5D2_02160 [Candidatus Nanoarchaeia archaeon]
MKKGNVPGFMGNDKRAQNITLATIILIVLGIAVLVFLIWGFSTGWSEFWERITGITGGSNVDNIKQSCSMACAKGESGQYAYCTEERVVKFGQEIKELGNKTTVTTTCKDLATNNTYKKYVSIQDCSSIC